MKRLLLILILAFLFIPSLLLADTIYLTNETVIKGNITLITEDIVVIENEIGVFKLNKKSIEHIEFDIVEEEKDLLTQIEERLTACFEEMYPKDKYDYTIEYYIIENDSENESGEIEVVNENTDGGNEDNAIIDGEIEVINEIEDNMDVSSTPNEIASEESSEIEIVEENSGNISTDEETELEGDQNLEEENNIETNEIEPDETIVEEDTGIAVPEIGIDLSDLEVVLKEVDGPIMNEMMADEEAGEDIEIDYESYILGNEEEDSQAESDTVSEEEPEDGVEIVINAGDTVIFNFSGNQNVQLDSDNGTETVSNEENAEEDTSDEAIVDDNDEDSEDVIESEEDTSDEAIVDDNDEDSEDVVENND